MPEIRFEGRGLEELARDCRAASAAVRREIDKTLVEIGTVLLAEAKEIASQHSQKVADTITLRVVSGMVIIRAGSDQVPIAVLWEMGNKDQRQRGRVTGLTFRHPVFGNKDVWVDQARYPFLRPALDSERARFRKWMNNTYDRALAPYRLKPTEGE